METEQKSKKQETHKNSLLSYTQEMQLVAIIQEYLEVNGKPVNAEPIQDIITQFCKDYEVTNEPVSLKTTYKLLKKHENLKRLYFPERKEQERIQQEVETPQTTHPNVVSFQEYQELVLKYNFLLQKVNELESRFMEYIENFKSSFFSWLHQSQIANLQQVNLSNPQGFTNLNVEQQFRDPFDEYFANFEDEKDNSGSPGYNLFQD